jgi:hypothetical protein
VTRCRSPTAANGNICVLDDGHAGPHHDGQKITWLHPPPGYAVIDGQLVGLDEIARRKAARDRSAP